MNINIQNIFLTLSLILIVIMYFEINNLKKSNVENFNNSIIEHMTDAEIDAKITEKLQQEYNYDLEAIRNLGAISKSLLTGKNYHETPVIESSISYEEKETLLCKANSDIQIASSKQEAIDKCNSLENCGGFSLTINSNGAKKYILHSGINGTTVDGATNTSVCHTKIVTESNFDNNKLTIPANVHTLGSHKVTGNSNVNGNFVVEGTFNLLPAGTIIIWVEQKIPNGWKMCNGNGTYTNVDGEIKNIPDLRGRFILGAGSAADNNTNTYTDDGGDSAGYETQSYSVQETGGVYKFLLTEDELAPHKHEQHSVAMGKGGMNRFGHSDEMNPTQRDYSVGTDKKGFPLTNSDIWRPGNDEGEKGTKVEEQLPHNNMPPYYTVFYIIKVY